MKPTPRLTSLCLPRFGPEPDVPLPPSAAKLLARIAAARQRMRAQELSHLVLSNLAGAVQPYLLAPQKIITLH